MSSHPQHPWFYIPSSALGYGHPILKSLFVGLSWSLTPCENFPSLLFISVLTRFKNSTCLDRVNYLQGPLLLGEPVTQILPSPVSDRLGTTLGGGTILTSCLLSKGSCNTSMHENLDLTKNKQKVFAKGFMIRFLSVKSSCYTVKIGFNRSTFS